MNVSTGVVYILTLSDRLIQEYTSNGSGEGVKRVRVRLPKEVA